MKHVMVTGANGYLGAVLVPALLASKRVGRVTARVRRAHRSDAGGRDVFPSGISVVDLRHVLARCALADKELALPAHGQQKLDLMDVRDATAVVVKLIESGYDRWPEVMNVGSGAQVTLLALAKMVSKLTLASHTRPLLFRLDENNLRKQRNFGMAIARLESTLDWRAGYTPEKTLVDIISLLARFQSDVNRI